MTIDDLAILCEDEPEEVQCPSCSTEQPPAWSLIGSLGRTEHHRCRFCGWQWAENRQSD